MYQRIPGGIAIALGLGVLAFGLGQFELSQQVAVALRDAPRLKLPVSPDLFLSRAHLMHGVTMLAGSLTVISGVAAALKRRWALYVAISAAMLVIVFPPISRLCLPDAYAFAGPGLPEFLLAFTIGLSASIMFFARTWRKGA